MYQQLQEIKGKHVVALTEGRDMGVIHKVFLDPKKKRVSGITVRESRFGGDDKWVNIDKIERLGEDYLFISRAVDCQEKEPKGRSLKDLIGIQVTTKDGKILGSLVDIEVNDDWGVMEIDLSGKRTVKLENGEAVFGEDAILLRAGVQPQPQTDRGRSQGFLARVFGTEVSETAEALSRAEKRQSAKEEEKSGSTSLHRKAKRNSKSRSSTTRSKTKKS